MYVDKTKHGTFLAVDISGEPVGEFKSYEAAEFWIDEYASMHTPDINHRPHCAEEGY